MAGTLAGSDSWFQQTADPNKRVSAHYGVSLNGLAHQYVHLDDTAWANGVQEPGNRWAPRFGSDWANDETITIETEDLNNAQQVVTEQQYQTTLALCRLALAKNPSIKVLATHASISPQSRANCPGRRWIASGRFAALAQALGLDVLL